MGYDTKKKPTQVKRDLCQTLIKKTYTHDKEVEVAAKGGFVCSTGDMILKKNLHIWKETCKRDLFKDLLILTKRPEVNLSESQRFSRFQYVHKRKLQM